MPMLTHITVDYFGEVKQQAVEKIQRCSGVKSLTHSVPLGLHLHLCLLAALASRQEAIAGIASAPLPFTASMVLAIHCCLLNILFPSVR